MEEEWKGPDHGSHARCNGFVGRGAALRRGGAFGRGAALGRGGAFGRGAALGRGGAFGRGAALGRGGAFGRGAALGRGGAFGRGAALGRGGAFGRGAALGRGGAFGRGAALGRGGAFGRGAALGRGGAVGRGAALGRGSGGRGVAGGGDVARGGGAAAAGGGGAALGGRGRGATGGIAAAVVKGAVGGRAAALGRGEAVGKGTAGGRGAASERGVAGGRGAIRGRGGAFGRGASAGRGSGGRGVAGGGDVARGGGAAARGGGVAVGGGGRGATGGRGIDGCSRGVAGEADATGSRGTARGRGAAGHGGAAGGRVSVGHGGAARGGDAGGGDAVGNRGAAGVGDAVGSAGGGERGKKGSGGRRGGGGAERAGSSGGNRKDGDAPGRHSRDEGRSPSAKRKDGSHRNAFKILHKLSGKNPSEVAITLSSISTLQDLLNDKEMRQDLVQLLCSVLCKAFQARRDRGTRRHLAGMVKDSEFLRFTLPHHVEKMASESCTVRRKQYTDHLDNILAVVFEVLKTFPNSSLQSLSMLVRVLPSSSRDLRVAGMNVLPETDEKLVEIQELVSLQKKSRESTSKPRWRPKNTGGENHGVEEQEDFRNLPICPTPEEMHEDQRPFLRPNLTSEPYASNHLYLDTHFRLLREDFVRPLREGIQQLLQRQMANDSSLRRKRLDDITVYRDTRLVEPVCTHVGVAYVVQFDPQPFKGVRWENSKRLIYGSLVCLSCDNFESFLYATVSDSEPRGLRKGRVQLIFTEESRDKLMAIQADRFLMVESTAFFEAYRHVLEGLQEQEEARLPFQRYIVDCNTDVLPPAYLKKRGDTYNMSSIVHPEHRSSIQPFHCLKPEAWPKKEVLGLDESQMRALQLALTNELAIIQGPPGTGKTYTGLKIAQALLTNEGLWSSGAPMLVVCFTNHALDQFLEGILKFLPKGIVRVGGRSNSEALKKFNLRELTHDLPWYLRSAKREIYMELDEVKREIKPLVARLGCSLKGILQESFLETFMLKEHRISLHRPLLPDQGGFEAGGEKIIMEWLGIDSTVFQRRATEEAIGNGEGATAEDEEMLGIMEQAGWIQAERILEDFHPRFDRDEEMDTGVAGLEEQMLALNIDHTERQADPSDEGWEMQRQQRRKLRDRIRKELDLSSDMTEAEEKEVLDVWLLSLPDRWRIYRLWVARYRMALRSKALRPAEAYQHVVDRLADVKRSDRLCVLRKAKVIGMTTTGAAKSRDLIQELEPRLVIVEEAAQVLEAHILPALGGACEHLILIGDHQQLRPSATVYDLAMKYNLEVSMFERLIKMNLPYVRLNSQHRMKPNIASLLTPHIYAELENHPSVMAHEDIMGLKTNLFFLEHNHHEEHMRDGKSHQNQHEATFVVALCRYLLLQDYEPEQITILTTYTAQLLCLGRLMKTEKSFAGVKVHTVDKYQGEENDIILLSLVRSNAEGKVGFLRIPNRVCVALSRAKKALYCICNCEMLGGVELWAGIFGTLREKGEIGTALTLRCHNHPAREVEASCAEDFEQAPDGGCTRRCEFSLECGHPCTLYCHPRDPEHKKYQCPEKCARFLCDLKHGCPLRCHEPCPECMVMVEKTIPECQHKQMVPCHQDPETFACQEPCQKMLKCGHACTGTCHSCHQGRYHFSCAQRCERLLICSHKCQEICAPDCSACRRPCENRCSHGNCKHPCGHPCTPCTEPCAWQCPHQRCSKRCHEPCDRPPCVQPCDKILDCGHPCIGLCGEKCPKRCRVCDANVFGTEDADRTALYVQLEDCGHVVESTAIDSYMEMGDVQQSDEGKQVAIRLKDCPECQTPIRNNLRYGTQIKSILTEIEKVKVKLSVCQTDIAKKKKTLTKQWMMSGLQSAGYMDITAELSPRHLTMKDLCVLENKMAFLEKVEKLKRIQKKHMSGEEGLFEGEIQRFVMWLLDLKQKFTGQQVSDLQRELKRLILLVDHDIRCNLLVKEGATPGPFTEQDQVKEALECLEDMIHERWAIVPAIQMTPGHWYRCPKGHVYVMSEGGGATESERCPDCDTELKNKCCLA